jgi:molybdate transport system substrate-binding protein
MEINVLCAGAVKHGMKRFSDHFKTEAGHDLKIAFDTAPRIAKRIASGEICDILVCPPQIIDQLGGKETIAKERRVYLGRVGVGMAVRNDLPSPDISTPVALRDTVLNADSIVYNQASTGLYIERLLKHLGIYYQLQRKTTYYPNSARVLMQVRRGRGVEIGFAAITEIKYFEVRGVKLAGALPAQLQHWTDYEAVLMPPSACNDLARQAISEMGTPYCLKLFAETGVESMPRGV